MRNEYHLVVPSYVCIIVETCFSKRVRNECFYCETRLKVLFQGGLVAMEAPRGAGGEIGGGHWRSPLVKKENTE